MYTLADLAAVTSVFATVIKSAKLALAIFFLASPVVSVIPVSVPAVVSVIVLEIDNALSAMSVLVNVICAVVVAIFIYFLY
jgi:hypothetical protein